MSISNLCPLVAVYDFFDDLHGSDLRELIVENLSLYTEKTSVRVSQLFV